MKLKSDAAENIHWKTHFIGKEIDPVRAEQLKADGYIFSISRGVYKAGFKSESSCANHPAAIEVKVVTGKRIIKNIVVDIYVEMFNPPMQVGYVKSSVPIMQKDLKNVKDFLNCIIEK